MTTTPAPSSTPTTEPIAQAAERGRDRRVALVTGATAGIGEAFAVRLANDGWDLVLVARDEERLKELASALSGTHNVRTDILKADLSTVAGVEEVAERLRSTRIDLLVNNAGLSLNTPFLKSTVDRELYLLSVNVQAVMILTHAALVGMVSRGKGAIINVSSVAGFAATMPGSTYPASKAWVTNFSESIALSVARNGIKVMALAPGFTRSEFHSRAGIDMSKTPSWMWLSAQKVVNDALRDLQKGKTISILSVKYKILVAIVRHTPTRVLRKLAKGARVRTGRDTE
jgi:uncharacterized protein